MASLEPSARAVPRHHITGLRGKQEEDEQEPGTIDPEVVDQYGADAMKFTSVTWRPKARTSR